MSRIPLEDLLRLERGDLSGSAAERVENVLQSDPAAADWMAWIRALRSATQGPGTPTSGDDASGGEPATFSEIALLASDALDQATAATVRRKLISTPDGYDLLESALEEVAAISSIAHPPSAAEEAPLLPGPGHTHTESGSEPPFWQSPWTTLAAAVFLGLAIWIWRGRTSTPSIMPQGPTVAQLAVIHELPVPRLRAEDEGQGMRAYADKRFAEATGLFRNTLAANPASTTPWLYLGSAEFLLGNLAPAAEALETARRQCEPSYRVEATWQLAQVRLTQNRQNDARALLLELEGTRREPEAETLLRALSLH